MRTVTRSRAASAIVVSVLIAAVQSLPAEAALDEAALAGKGIVRASDYVPGRPSVVVVPGKDPDPKHFENLVNDLKKDHNVFFFVYQEDLGGREPGNVDLHGPAHRPGDGQQHLGHGDAEHDQRVRTAGGVPLHRQQVAAGGRRPGLSR